MTLKEMRELLGLTQKGFSEKYEIPKRSIENWEAGSRECPDYVLKLLERAVQSDLIGREYEDPDGEWRVIGFSEGMVDILCIQEDNINEGKELQVSIEEAAYYLNGGK